MDKTYRAGRRSESDPANLTRAVAAGASVTALVTGLSGGDGRQFSTSSDMTTEGEFRRAIQSGISFLVPDWWAPDWNPNIGTPATGAGVDVPVDLTPEKLRTVAKWLDVYESIVQAHVKLLDALDRVPVGTDPAKVLEITGDKTAQNDLRRWADEIEAAAAVDEAL